MAKTVTVTTIKKSIRTALAALGTTPNQIAASLKRRKIKGMPGHVEKCVLAQYVGKKCPNVAGLRTNGSHVWFRYEDINYAVPIAKRFAKFVDAFDTKTYPDLIAA